MHGGAQLLKYMAWEDLIALTDKQIQLVLRDIDQADAVASSPGLRGEEPGRPGGPARLVVDVGGCAGYLQAYPMPPRR